MGKAETDTFPKTTLFKNEIRREGEEKTLTYRIPSLVYLQQGKRYLAFAEKRTSLSDHDAKCFVIRRGTITDDGSVQWSNCEELSKAKLKDYRSMNPCPVYDSNTKKLFLFFICVYGEVKEQDQIKWGDNQTKLCLVTSVDHGDTWTDLEDLTESVIGETYSSWATFAVGPGHGIQLANGRLVVPAYAYYMRVWRCFFRLCCYFCCPCMEMVQQRALSIYSDDKGVTWRIGEPLGAESGECEMAEVIESDESRLYCSARRKETRQEAVSRDRGENFEKPYSGARLVEHGEGCQGSVISFPALMPSKSVPTWLAFSHPTKPERHDLGVYLNRTPTSNKSTWDPPMVINSGLSGYSDLAYNQDDRIFSCLLECGDEPKPGEKSKLERIDFTSFKLGDIRRPREFKMSVNLKVGDQLTVEGFIPAGAHMFIIDLGTGESDVALHFNPRFQEDGKALVVCNDRTAGEWGQEKKQYCPVICRGQNIKMVFKLMEGKFTVELPGGQEVDFPNRRAIQVISYVSVERDLNLCALFSEVDVKKTEVGAKKEVTNRMVCKI